MTTTCHSEWKSNYASSVRYAIKLFNSNRDNSLLPKDLVHEAYVYWKERKNEDLFLRNKHQIARVLKNIYYNRFGKTNWYYHGEFYPKSYSQDVINGLPKEEQVLSMEGLLSRWGMRFPEQTFENEEIVKIFRESLSEFDNRILSLKEEGYKNQEIEQIVGKSNPIITRSIKTIKRKMKEILLNPFNCSNVKVLHRVSRKTYESNKQQFDDFEMGEYSEYNEYYVLMTSKTNPKEGLLIKEQIRD